MEEKKHTGWSWCLSGVCLSPVSIMSYSLWRDRQVNAFMTTNRARGSSATLFLRPRGWSGTGAGGPSDKSSASVLQRLPL